MRYIRTTRMVDPLKAFRVRFPQYKSVQAKVSEEALKIGWAGDKPVMCLSFHNDEWLLELPDVHAHFDFLEDALDLLGLLLAGEARATSVFRSHELAATWIEVWDGECFEVQHTAVYLPPFDPEEWELRPGEIWRQVRTTHTVDTNTGEIRKESFERESDEPGWQQSTVDWFTEALGPPTVDMKWGVGQNPRFVFQIPKGFRRVQFDQETGFIDFAPQSADVLFRARQYFRDTEVPADDQKTLAVKPITVGYQRDDLTDPNWSIHRWTLMFSDGAVDMMGILELFFKPDSAVECEPMQRLVDASVSQALFVPDSWNMEREE
jgi:hypothetical protein